MIKSSLKGKHVLVTAGPTHEPIDPVRFIGNRSSGKMGYALCERLVQQGAFVTLVTGPTHIDLPSVRTIHSVQTAQQMYEKCIACFDNMDIAILAAAVADYTPKLVSDIKIKKKEGKMALELIPTKDIAKELGLIKKDNQLLVGFALETNNELYNAKLKRQKKNFDFIVLNSLQNKETCFGVDNNQIVIVDKDKELYFEQKSKKQVAKDIISHIESLL